MSECAITSTPSRSTVTVPPASGASWSANRQTRRRTSARTPRLARRAFSPEAARVSMRRETVGSEATGPNTAGSARSMATSARQSPPSATARTTSRRILPGSCTARAFRHGVTVADIAVSRPALRTGRPAARPRHARPPLDHRPRCGHAGTTGYASSPGECFFPCSRQVPRQVPSLQVRSTLRLFDQASDTPPREIARLSAML